MTCKGSFKIDIFECRVHITITDNLVASANYYLRKANTETLEGEFYGYFFRGTKNFIDYHMFISYKTMSTNYIAHEKSHLVDQILIDREIKPNDEVRAYLDGYITSKINIFLKRHNLKVKI